MSDFAQFENKTFLITGATGFIGSAVIKFLKNQNSNVKIIALARNAEKVKNLGADEVIIQDITEPLTFNGAVDYIIHAASNTSSKSFVETPVETILANVYGTRNVLEFARAAKVKSVVYLSSMEIYGDIGQTLRCRSAGASEPLKESDYGYLDVLNVRNSYPEAKRLAENLCVSYASEYGVPVKIARLCQVIGEDIPCDDNRVFAQFARNVAEGKDIIMHTTGALTRSYCHITDAVSAVLTVLHKGETAQAYNVANDEAVCSIKEMAEMMCKYGASKVVFEPAVTNHYFNVSRLELDTSKLKALGWSARVGLEEMFERLVNFSN